MPRGAGVPSGGGRWGAQEEAAGWSASLRRQGPVLGCPGGEGRPEQAGHLCGYAGSGRFEDRPPFPSSPPSLSLTRLYMGWAEGRRGVQALPCEQVLGPGDRQERGWGCLPRWPKESSLIVLFRNGSSLPPLGLGHPERPGIGEVVVISAAPFQRLFKFQLPPEEVGFLFRRSWSGEASSVSSGPTQLSLRGLGA